MLRYIAKLKDENIWIEHKLIKVGSVEKRDYQILLAKTAVETNTLIVLPTGLGKTTIALLIIADILTKTKDRCLFLAPTRVLVQQHYTYLQNFLDILDISMITGESVQRERTRIWDNSIICATPQITLNDLKRGIIKPNDFSLVIFDEAQRAWDQKQVAKFMAGSGAVESQMAEPEFLIGYMDRKTDWCTVICLIGGGQEINTGESGLIEWLNALENNFPHWDIYHSGQLNDKTYNLGSDLEAKLASTNATEKSMLHLDVSIRSFRAEKLSDFVKAVIDGDSETAKQIIPALNAYPMALTRNLDSAKSNLTL